MYKAYHISPMIPSQDLEETGFFFKDVLDFSTVMETRQYSIYIKNNLTVHVLPAGDDVRQMDLYMTVDDIEEFWNMVKDKTNKLKVKPPFNRDYGMREVHIEIPKTHALLFVGQEI